MRTYWRNGTLQFEPDTEEESQSLKVLGQTMKDGTLGSPKDYDMACRQPEMLVRALKGLIARRQKLRELDAQLVENTRTLLQEAIDNSAEYWPMWAARAVTTFLLSLWEEELQMFDLCHMIPRIKDEQAKLFILQPMMQDFFAKFKEGQVPDMDQIGLTKDGCAAIDCHTPLKAAA